MALLPLWRQTVRKDSAGGEHLGREVFARAAVEHWHMRGPLPGERAARSPKGISIKRIRIIYLV